ncbi:MAG: PAS domain S-box protein [Deltaproteobacteria bacterium]|nr:MAG: PAS domain S-box protein [Deltaproteobacteria bacterium]
MSARTKARPAPAGPSRPDWTDVLASIEDGVVVIDPAGAVADLNPAAEQLVGVSAPQVVGRPFDDLFAGEQVRSAEHSIGPASSCATRSPRALRAGVVKDSSARAAERSR